MKEENELYRQDVAFIDRQKELTDLKLFIDKRPSEILFIHGPIFGQNYLALQIF